MTLKRFFDFFAAFLGLFLLAFPLLLFAALAAWDTKSNGFFRQQRIGQYGKPFWILKLRSMHKKTGEISSYGKFLRTSKIDELPQLVNVLMGDMSFVGPRPDVAGYYDTLEGEESKILDLKPGLTSEAGLKYYNEDALLAAQEKPLEYNDEVLFPDKVRLNLEYYYKRSFWGDLKIIWKTVFR